jgi:hypothetical protein
MSCLEMVTLLCIADKTHSQLMELMPERCGTTQNRDFESVLAEVCCWFQIMQYLFLKKFDTKREVRLNIFDENI